MSKNKLSRRITWRVIGIMVFFNVLIIAAILFFVRDVSLLLGSSRCQYVSEGIGGKIESMRHHCQWERCRRQTLFLLQGSSTV